MDLTQTAEPGIDRYFLSAMQGMHTAQPRLEWPGGTVLLGSYEETVGTQLLFSDAVSDDGSHQVELVAQNRNRVVFRKSTAKPGLGVTSVGWQRIPLPRTSPDKRRKPKEQRRQQQQVQEEPPPQQQQQEQQQQQQHTNHSNGPQSQQPQKGQHSHQQQLQQKQ